MPEGLAERPVSGVAKPSGFLGRDERVNVNSEIRDRAVTELAPVGSLGIN